MEVLLEGLIDPLGLPISLGMISQDEMKLHTGGSTKTAEEIGNEL